METDKVKKILIIGGVAGGASAAARIRRIDEKCKIIMFERGPHVSFSNCSLPFYLSNTIKRKEKLILLEPDDFYHRYRIDARVNNEVIEIDKTNKQVKVKDLVTEKTYMETYDKLILSPGANPIVPNFEGIELINLFTIRNVNDIVILKEFIENNKSKEITVIGGGFIGIETAENLCLAGYKVTIIESMPQIMRTFDYDMVQILHKEIIDKGIRLIVGDKVEKFQKDTLILESGKSIHADAVIMAIGVSPEINLAKEAGLKIGETGGIAVNHNFNTSDKDIYAVGDAIEVYHSLLQENCRLPLAGPAQKQARAVAGHIYGEPVYNSGVIGSSIIKVFDYNAASTGLTEGMIKSAKRKINYTSIVLIPNDKVKIMPESNPIHFKLIFELPTGRILGAQAIGKGNVDKRVDVVAALIKLNATLEDLKDLDLCYAPSFGTARDVVNLAGLVGLNILYNRYKQVHVNQIRELVNKESIIIDVREKYEYEAGHIINSINIPLEELRDRINEIPKDKPVYINCRSGQRSYLAIMILQNLAYDNVYNVAGGFLGLSFYEYFNDKTSKNPSILTQYIFK